MSTLTLNTTARAMDVITSATKVRFQMRGDTMFIRPTDRKARVNLRKDEFLVDLAGGKFTIEGLEQPAGNYGLQADKYGWFALTPGHTGRGASVKVA